MVYAFYELNGLSKAPLQKIFRSEYFKTALNTAVGGQKRDREVEECSFKVLSAIIGFMYRLACT